MEQLDLEEQCIINTSLPYDLSLKIASSLQVEYVLGALENNKISERRVYVKWWKVGRWSFGFRLRDESHSRCVSLKDLAVGTDEDALRVLKRGAVYEVIRVQISISNDLHPSIYIRSQQTA